MTFQNFHFEKILTLNYSLRTKFSILRFITRKILILLKKKCLLCTSKNFHTCLMIAFYPFLTKRYQKHFDIPKKKLLNVCRVVNILFQQFHLSLSYANHQRPYCHAAFTPKCIFSQALKHRDAVSMGPGGFLEPINFLRKVLQLKNFLENLIKIRYLETILKSGDINH